MGEESVTLKKEPSAAEALLFYAIVKHMKNKADVDWDAVAADVNFKNAAVAKVRFGQIKRKLGLDGGSPKKNGETVSSPTTPTKVNKVRGGKEVSRAKHVKKEDTDEFLDQTLLAPKFEDTENGMNVFFE